MPPLPQHIENRLDLRPWSLTYLLIKDYLPTTFEASGAERSWVKVAQVWETNMTFCLDLWPTDLNIYRDNLLIKEYLPTSLKILGQSVLGVISCTRLRDTDIPTDRPTYRYVQSNMPLLFQRGHEYDCVHIISGSNLIKFVQYEYIPSTYVLFIFFITYSVQNPNDIQRFVWVLFGWGISLGVLRWQYKEAL